MTEKEFKKYTLPNQPALCASCFDEVMVWVRGIEKELSQAKKEAEEKDKEIQFLQKRMSDAAIAAKQFVDSNFCALQAECERSKEWKLWAERLARYIECPTIFLSGEPGGNGLLTDFQKFKESKGKQG